MSLSEIQTETDETILYKRIIIHYSAKEQQIIEFDKDIVLLEIEKKHFKEESIIYVNQEKCASEIVSILKAN